MKARQSKGSQKDLFELLPDAISRFRKNVIDPFFSWTSNTADESQPLRAEIYTEEQLELHAISLAGKHVLISKHPSEQLLGRLSENERILLEVHAILTQNVKQSNRIVPAAEWLLDNFYLIEEQIYTAKKHLPKGYSKGLPQLEKGASAGLPRVYDIAIEIISHSDGHVNLRSLVGFVNAYQTVNALKIGELWAIPIMLRLALLENLRRLAIQISIDITNKSLAESWADQLIDVAERDPKNLVLVIADMARSKPPMASSFVAELTRRLQEKGNSLVLAMSWLEQTLSENGQTSGELVQIENQRQAADQVSISNSINSLRFLSTTDWREFVEQTSAVEKILRQDPSGIYARMDFYTRDNYRHTVETIAKHSVLSEETVATVAIEQARQVAGQSGDERLSHVGYYLNGKGLRLVERKVRMKVSAREACRRIAKRIPLYIYAGGIIILSLLACYLLINKANEEITGRWSLITFGIITLIAVSQLGVGVINWIISILARPCMLPRMDYSKGLPADRGGLVAVPAMLNSISDINHLIENLEVRFLANRDNNLFYALVTDYKDARQQETPEDKLLLQHAINKITDLNKKYGPASGESFFLLHRDRQWNPREKRWMGEERKRGKLADLNALIMGYGEGKFSHIVGDPEKLSSVKYVITLDADTQLPRDAAWKMIATMSHPLNQPVYNAKKRRVTEGYTILQPRVSNSLAVGDSSIYERIHGNEPGTDPYTKAISDIYQDMFEEGSFIGKGIYEVESFERTLKDRLPLNAILSHDLLEGAYARAGLITDVQLYEEYPSSYIADMQRRHRWVRGDWQIAGWILPFVSGPDNRLHKNPLTLLSKWKIFDNLRRSLVPLAYVLLLLYGWLISGSPLYWTFALLLVIFLPAILNFAWQLIRKPPDVLFTPHLTYTARSLKDHIAQQAIGFICLPYEAFMNADAILRTLWRMFITRKKLLQWNPYTNIPHDKRTMAATYRNMWVAPFFASAVFVYLSVYLPITLIKVIPLLSLWFIAPMIAWYISRPVAEKKVHLSHNESVYLRTLARKIWAFFEQFVSADDNWLPPDNYQEQPVERIAHRTSPTNIGLCLLGNFSAYDFGYITVQEMLHSLNRTISSIEKLEKYRGHLYNWYDTQTLIPLFPKYISTVDSGNFVGHLITLQQGLLTVQDQKIVTAAMFEGLLDEVRITGDLLKLPALRQLELSITHDYPDRLQSLPDVYKYLLSLGETVQGIVDSGKVERGSEGAVWLQKLVIHLDSLKKELHSLVPWLMLPPPPEKFKELVPLLPGIPTIIRLAKIEQSLLNKINALYSADNSAEEDEWLNNYRAGISASGQKAKEMILLAEQLFQRCSPLIDIDYEFLFDRSQNLLTIGYNAEEHRRDNSFYDLLASEARLTTFIGIAMGKLPQQSWFALGRQLTNVGTTPILLSWSGSMFEYLMPQLVMPAYEKTLLDQTNKAVIQKQVEYGKRKGVPWGISESGYNMVDASLNYQYHAFGVPGLGLKRGLGEDLVISPYSTVMALMVAPRDAYENLQTMKSEGFEGRYGFYEAIDYTSSRLLRKQSFAIVKSFMAHHQGMSLLSLDYLLLGQRMQQRFESDVKVKSALLLLQERIPRVTTFYSPSVHEADTSITPGGNGAMRVLTTPDTQIPEVQLLSNGRYHVMVTNAGGGYSRWRNIALTRWREDCTCDDWGTYCFIRDLDSNVAWSAAHQPSLAEADNYEAVFSQGRAEFRRRDKGIETHTEIVVSPEDDIELRRVHITNRSRKKRTLEITSFAEVVLANPMADASHPAFSNLFVQTELREQRNAIVCNRRPRSTEEKNPTMFHLMKVHDADIKSVSYETDREKFIGRGRTIHNPRVISQANPLSNSSGSVLDPAVSIQYRITIEPYQTAIVDMIFGIAETRETCNFLIDKYQDRHLINRILELAFTHSQVILRQINAVEADAQLYSRLASSIIFANASMRADASTLIKNQRGQSGLWSYSISGDLPIVLLQIEDSSNIELVKQLVQAHTYWRLKGLLVDLVIWNEDHGGYRQVLQNQILGFVSPALSHEIREQPGGIFVRSADQISNEDRILFQTVAHVVITDRAGTLEEQITGRARIKTSIPNFSPTKFTPSLDTAVTTPTDLQFFNGYGGFSQDGKEYVVITAKESTPAPWINVLANRQFGCIVSESGQSYTWFENAHEYRLTPWNNDPVVDLRGEAYYIRDEESGKFWSPTPLPCRGKSAYITRHGFGYSCFAHSEDGIETELCTYADVSEPVKFMVLKLRNKSKRKRRLSVSGYVEWVLGDLRSKTLKHVITEIDTRTGALLARNPYNTEFENRVAFFDVDGQNKSYSADRTEFIGRNGTMGNPEAMSKTKLSGRTGAALDPCAAIQVVFDLAEEEEHEVVFRLGAARNTIDAFNLIRLFEGSMTAKRALEKVQQYWKETLQAVVIETPDPAINILSNGWLNYQALACRYFARSGFYQSGGAFGFRDQLQDVLSLLHTKPALAREQILLSASRQFREGDVQHWWHPPAGRGVRTTCSDDFLWLPYVTTRYITVTGDQSILDEMVNFLEGRLLNADEDSYYDLPIRSDSSASLYRHCVAAIENGLRFGANGLPLIGSGDWNDGMDKVGHHARGESVWLAFFLYEILQQFITVAQSKNDQAFALKCGEQAGLLKRNINEHAWDGEWYRRAYFDDGFPLGSTANDECRIDSIAQSWSVLSKGGEPAKSSKAMRSAYKYLVKKEDQLIQLFTPPFDKSKMNPGYIKGYVPGVRENGGQYTHAAIWLVMAFAAMGDKQKTWELLQLINPVNHGKDPSTIRQYKVEPYVIAADVYFVETHRGRGGWTWYTGSAGWMYQLILEWFIGLKRRGSALTFEPCLPPDWKSVKINYRFNDSIYLIELLQTKETGDGMRIVVDGKQEPGNLLHLSDDGETHEVQIYLQEQPVAVLEK